MTAWVVVTAVVLMVNCGDTVAPAATVTEEGGVAAGLLLESVTVAPPDGAGPLIETVFAVVEPPPTTEVGDKFSDEMPATGPVMTLRFEVTLTPW